MTRPPSAVERLSAATTSTTGGHAAEEEEDDDEADDDDGEGDPAAPVVPGVVAGDAVAEGVFAAGERGGIWSVHVCTEDGGMGVKCRWAGVCGREVGIPRSWTE